MSLTEAEASELEREASDDLATPTREVWKRLRANPSAVVGGIFVALFMVVALVGPLVAPHSPTDGDLTRVRPGFVPGPSLEHPLGLDSQGRDELARILHGARYSLAICVASVALGTVLGILLGAVAAGIGGWVDTVLMRLVDVLLAIPGLLLAIGIAALLGPGLRSVTIAIAVAGVPIVARLVRATMVVQRETDYALAARALGVKRWRIVTRHLLPNSLAPVLAGTTLALGGAILVAAGLAFLGLGAADPSTPEWGRMLSEAQRSLDTAPQLALFPGAAIVMAVLGFNLVGEALREALDPKLRD